MGFVSIIWFDGAPAEASLEERLSRALSMRTNDSIVANRFRDAILLQRRDEIARDLPVGRELSDRGSGRTSFAGSGRIDNRQELVEALARRADALGQFRDCPLSRCLLLRALGWGELTLGRDCVGRFIKWVEGGNG